MGRKFPEEHAALRHLLWLLGLIPLTGACMWLGDARPGWTPVILLLQAIVQAPLIVLAVLPFRRARRARGLLIRESGYRFCPDCGYDLRATPGAETCPECGASYPAKERELIWRDRYRFLEPRWYGDRATPPDE